MPETTLLNCHTLSATQRRLWSLQQEVGASIRNYLICEIRELLDVQRFQHAFRSIVANQAELRVRYTAPETGQGESIPIETFYEPALTEAFLTEAAHGEDSTSSAFLVRSLKDALTCNDDRAVFVLARVNESQFYFIGSAPAINADGLSLRKLVVSLAAAYHDRDEGTAHHDSPKFRDVADWSNSARTPDGAESFWRGYLAQIPWSLNLPLERVGDLSKGFETAFLSWELPTGVLSAMNARGTDALSWLRAQLVTAAQAWLSNVCDARRVFVGVMADDRLYPELYDAVGPYEKELPFYSDVATTTTFADLSVAVDTRLQELFDWQEGFSLELADTPEFTASRLHEYPICIDVRRSDESATRASSIFSTATILSSADAYAIKLDCEISDGKILARIFYHTAAYSEESMRRVREQLTSLLVVSLEQPHECILGAMGSTKPAPQTTVISIIPAKIDTVQQMFEFQAVASTDAPALSDGELHVTYGCLHRLSSQLASRMVRESAIGRDTLVALHMSTGMEAAVAILAVLKAGGAYVPLDPNWPLERIHVVLSETAPAAVLTATYCPEAETKGIPQFRCDLLSLSVSSDPPVATLPAQVAPANLAYVLYTSGTSGVPKGVMITHQGLSNYISWCASEYQLSASRGAIVHSPLTFDFTVTCLLAPLTVGACVYFCRADSPLEGLADALARLDEVSLIKITPTSIDPLYRLMQQRHILCRVRRIVVGGEALVGTAQLWSVARQLDALIVNEYGPTECVVGSNIYAAHFSAPTEGPIPIGRPVANTWTPIIDHNGKYSDTWVPGEIYIGGWGVARGYLKRPRQTAESFVPNFETTGEGDRLYRTGDIGRSLATNELMYIGRRDTQVKIRGHRIDLLEIESAIQRTPGVAQCVVTALEEQGSHQRLAAFVTLAEPHPQNETELRAFLTTLLPAYMVPSVLHVVPYLPLTTNGKVDVKTLEAWLAEFQRRPVPPREQPHSEAEKALHRLWLSVLRCEHIGLDDNFFELGGDSILSIQFLARAHETGWRLRPRDLAQHPTIRELAAVATQSLPQVVETARKNGSTIPLTPIQQWFFEHSFEQPHHYNQSVLLRVPKSWPLEQFERAAAVLIQHHDAFRLSFLQSEDGCKQVYSEEVSHNIVKPVDCLGLSEPEVWARMRAAARDTQISMKLDLAPLLRMVWFRSDEQNFLYVVAHHLIIDHVSWAVLLEDLHVTLQRVSAGTSLPQIIGTTSYAAWAEQLAKHTTQEQLNSERDYWLSERWNRVPSFPADHPQHLDQNLVRFEESVSVTLDPLYTHKLVHETLQAYHTRPVDLLIAAYAAAYSSWSGNRVMSLEFEGHGRDTDVAGVDTSRSIGWFTALYPIYLAPTNTNDNGDLIAEIKEAIRAVPPNRRSHRAQQYFNPAHHTIQISFNYLGDVDRTVKPAGSLEWVPVSLAENRSPENTRPYLLEVGAYISDGQLKVTFTYGSRIHERSTIVALSEIFLSRLKSIVDHCSGQPTIRYTPSDFPLARLSQDTLQDIVAAHPDLEDIYRLTHVQQGMLFHATESPSAPAYVLQLRMHLSGLDPDLFEESWGKVFARHSALRTSFLWDSVAEPVQIVHRFSPPSFATIDMRGESISSQAKHISDWVASQMADGIDLSKAPLHRLAIFRVGPAEFEFVWLYHHILIDGWSTSNILREVLQFYALARGKGPNLSPAAGLYRDYVAWLASRPTEDSRRYWQEAMNGVTAGTVLAFGKQLPIRRSSAVHRDELLHLSRETIDGIASTAKRLRIPPNIIAQGAWALVLSRYARTDDVVFGVTVSGRPYDLSGVEHRVGLFLNTLPMRIEIRRAATVAEYLEGLQQQLQELLQHDHIPLFEVSRFCQVPQGEPLFESIVVFENFPKLEDTAMLQDEVVVSSVSSIEQTNYPLTIVIGGKDADLSVRAIYDPGRFETTDIRQLLTHFGEALQALTSRMEAPIGQLPIQWSQQTSSKQVNVDQDSWSTESIHRLFEQQALKTPDAIAVVRDEQQISYDLLNRRANQLARRLVELGVGPETFVAVCVERSLEMIVALLATLKAGAAYLPIDCKFPAERVASLARRAAIIILDETSSKSFSFEGGHILDLHLDAPAIEAQADNNLTEIVTLPSQVAYLMHTSGSSGKPKGTLVTHENVTRLFGTAFQLYDFVSDGVWSFFHSIAFDFSVWEIFGALLTGGRLVVTPYWVARSPQEFVELIRREGITVLSQTPSAFRELLHVGKLTASDEPLNLRWVVFGGEALHLAPLVDYCRDLERNGTRLVNMYGITETTVHVTHRLMDDYATVQDRSYIGHALPDLTIHLLDQHLSPVPDGVAGEICVGGKGVARGYVDSPRHTAERFVPDPFAIQAGSRLYRSGDLARTAANSDLEYLGRNDRQVKIRGFRIELDEVLFHLRKQPAVRDALVRTVEDHSGDHVLVAYVVPMAPSLSLTTLRTSLQDDLPDYMIPSVIHVLESFPLTSNGKVDYKALLSGMELGAEPQKGVIPPQTWEQEVIADVWREVLGVSEVSIHDSFFALGGDSIKALRVVARLRSLGFDVSTETLFEYFCIAELSRVLPSKATAQDGPGAELIPAKLADLPHGVIDEYPATQLQLGMLFHGGEPGEEPAHYHNVSLLRLEGIFDEERFRIAVRWLIAKHPTLRTAFALEGRDLPMQVVFSKVDLPVTIISLRQYPAVERESRILDFIESETRNAFALHLAPLIRFNVLICSHHEFCLAVTEHHTILDGWSVASLLTELFEIYLRKPVSVEPEPYDSSRNAARVYARLERNAIDSPEQRDFWSNYLDGYKPLQLPAKSISLCADSSLPSSVKKVRATLETSLAQRLRELSQEIQVPFKSVLLSAHVAVLGFLTNQPDTITGLITHGRPEIEGSEQSLGLFLNTLPLRLKQTPITWKAWIKRVFKEELRVLPYRRFPVAAMRDEYGRPPQLSTAFNYTNFHVYDRLPRSEDIRILNIEVEESTNFDLLTDFCLLSRTGEIELTLSYSSAKFETKQIDGLLASYLRCLEIIANSPSERMNVSLSPEKPHRQPLPENAEANGRWPQLQTLLADSSNGELCDRIAVVAGDSHMSYGELSAKVTQVTTQLQMAGLTPESPVAVLMDKSPEWIASAMAVIQAGGVYVPLDRTDPVGRIQHILRETGAPVMLTDREDREISSENMQNILVISSSSSSSGWGRPASSQWPVVPDNLAYILYTSGSTGKPKGVAVHHGCLANLMNWQSQTMPMESIRILQYASPGFDVSVQEILTALCGGNTLVIAPAEVRRDFVALSHLVVDQQIECIFAPNTVIKALLMTTRECCIRLDALKTIINAGEALTIEDELLQFVASGGKVHNHYGPTETHVVTAASISTRNTKVEVDAPIGEEIKDVHVDILDWWCRPVLPGAIAEIYIGGPAVARGYHRAPRLTAERFLPNGVPNARLGSRVFRTGDFGYRDEDGVIRFKGRGDNQIKLRGYRIELDEIRHVLLECPDVSQAIVTTVGDQEEKRICAFLVSKREMHTDQLRDFTSHKLPAYMVPSLFIRIAACPTTRNGKIDYATLDKLAKEQTIPTDKVEGPIGAELAALWKEVLKNEKEIGPGHDFLQIGGNSILLLQLQLKLQRRFRVRVPIATLARYSSFNGMCQCINDELVRIAVSEPKNQTRPFEPCRTASPIAFPEPAELGVRSVG